MLFEFATNLVISSEANVTSFPESIDYFLSRFLPFPLDLRSLVYGFKVEGGTPFLETQANVPLGMLWLWLVYSFVQLKKQQPFQWGQSLSIILSILLFSMITWMSLSTKPYQFLPDYFQNIQFTYRIVFYQNLAIIFAVYSLFQAWPKNPKDTQKTNFSKNTSSCSGHLSFLCIFGLFRKKFARVSNCRLLKARNSQDFARIYTT
jgi:hypothetical protein